MVVMLLRLEWPSLLLITNSGGQIKAIGPDSFLTLIIGQVSRVQFDEIEP